MKSVDLAGAWRLHRVSTKESFPAAVPGDTHSALLAAGKIPDPYWAANELDVQWVGQEDWAYERSFDVTAALLAEDRVDLSCDCLDTIAEVFLNGKKVGSADNMFVRWRFDAKPHLRPGKNTHPHPLHAPRRRRPWRRRRSFPIPFPTSSTPSSRLHRNLVRKVQCHARLGLGSLPDGGGDRRGHLPGGLLRRSHRLRAHRAEARAGEMRGARVRGVRGGARRASTSFP